MNCKTIFLTVAALAATVPLRGAEHRRVGATPEQGTGTHLTNGVYSPQAIRTMEEYHRRLGRARGAEAVENVWDGVRPLNTSMPRPARAARRSAYNPQGNMYAVVPNYMGMESYSQAFWGTIDLAEGTVNSVFTGQVFSNPEEYELQAGAVRDGILYIPQFLQDMVTQQIEIRWKRVDISTGAELEPVSFGGDTNAYCYSLTYDEANDRFVGLGMDVFSGAMGNLVIVTGEGDDLKAQMLGNLGSREGDFMAGITYNPADGMCYGVKDNGGFYMIDVDWCDASLVKMFDESNEWFMIPTTYPEASPLAYSPRDKAFVTVCRDNVGRRMVLGFLDAESWDAVEGYDLFPVAYVASLWCPDAYAADAAPDVPYLTDILFEGASLSGTATLTAPGTNFAGEQITGNVVMSLALNGESVYEDTFTPGEQRVIPLEVAEGFYTASLTAWIEGAADAVSPAASGMFYAGNDNPLAPRGLAYAGGTLSWEPVGGEGAHHGYVDTEALTYDVWMDGVRQNSEPLTATSMAIVLPDSPRRVDLTVTASANGRTSEHSAVVNRVLGEGFALPVHFTPTRDEADLFTVYNANGDDYEFRYVETDEGAGFRIRTGYYYEKPDDWLFLPAVSIEDVRNQYSLLLTYVNSFATTNAYDNLQIWIGTEPSVEAMTEMIYSHTARTTPAPVALEARFHVEKPGSYVLGIYAGSEESGQYRGVTLSDISVSSMEGSTVQAPGDPQITWEAAPLGELAADIIITAPTVDLTGAPLAEKEKIFFDVTCGESSAEASALPGARTKTTVSVPVNGFNEVTVTPRNSFGQGIPRLVRVFAGIDRPSTPRNVKLEVSSDNMGCTLTWEPPLAGVNGGYVNPAGLTYSLYIQGSAGNHTPIGTTDQCKFTYQYTSSEQARPYIGVTAVNSLGEASDPYYIADFMGRPHELPMNEEFGYAAFTYPGMWKNDVSAEFGNCLWNSVNDLTGLGVGNPVFVEGGLQCVNLAGGNASGKLIASKFTTKDVPAAAAEIVYWDYSGAGDLELWVRNDSNREERLLASLAPDHDAGAWKTWRVPLPEELLDESWVQLNLVCRLGSTETAILDAYRVVQNIEYDFKVLSLTAPHNVFVGETAGFHVEAVNSGNEPMGANLVLDLLADGKVVDTQTATIGRTPAGRSYERNFGFVMKTEYTGCRMEVRATIDSEEDQVASNNVAVASFMLTENVVPVVDDLRASAVDNGRTTLSWSRPDTSYGDFESFESIPAFAIADNIGGWLNVDRDGMAQFPIQALRWEGDDQPSAWTVFDAEEKGTMSDDRLSPRSGSKMLMARSIMYEDGVEAPTQNSDWLISPEVKGGTTVTFWMNTISSQYSETVAIYYSTTERDPEYFVKGRNFTKTGSETWEELSWTLPEEAKYFALVYESWGTFAAMIDDIRFTPVALSDWDIVSYDIWKEVDGEFTLVAKDVKAEGAEVEVDRGATYYVTVNADRGDGVYASPMSNGVYVGESGIEGVSSATGVIGAGRGFIFIGGHAGERVEVYAVDGRVAAAVASAADRETIDLPAGVYTVKAGRATAKVLVK